MTTQKEMILEYMRKHKKGITQLQALDLFGCMRLGARIADLKAEGHKIETTMISVKKKDGRAKQYACYHLEES